jgi:hypothetical protein
MNSVIKVLIVSLALGLSITLLSGLIPRTNQDEPWVKCGANEATQKVRGAPAAYYYQNGCLISGNSDNSAVGYAMYSGFQPQTLVEEAIFWSVFALIPTSLYMVIQHFRRKGARR